MTARALTLGLVFFGCLLPSSASGQVGEVLGISKCGNWSRLMAHLQDIGPNQRQEALSAVAVMIKAAYAQGFLMGQLAGRPEREFQSDTPAIQAWVRGLIKMDRSQLTEALDSLCADPRNEDLDVALVGMLAITAAGGLDAARIEDAYTQLRTTGGDPHTRAIEALNRQ